MTESIVLQVCAECKVDPKQFFGPGRGTAKLSRARRLAIKRLQEAGFKNAAVARLIRRNYSTVQYWSRPDYREHRINYYRKLRSAAMGAEL